MIRLLFSFVGFLIALPALAQAPTAEQKQATLAWVKSLQNENGGFAADAKSDASLPATLAAERVFKYFGGELPKKDACGKFVESCFEKESGGFAATPGGKPDVRTTALGIMAAIELKTRTAMAASAAASQFFPNKCKNFDDVRLVAAALEAIGTPGLDVNAYANKTFVYVAVQLQWPEYAPKANADGTFGEGGNIARDTAGAVVTFLRFQASHHRLGSDKLDELSKILQKEGNPHNLKNPLLSENKEVILKALRAGQRPDGGWGKADAPSDLETTYRVMRAFWMLKAKPDVAACQKFIASCRNADGSYSVQPGQPANVSATYFAAIVGHWAEDLK